jgi:hypothetical protein
MERMAEKVSSDILGAKGELPRFSTNFEKCLGKS